MQKRGSVNEFNGRRQLVMAGTVIADQFGAREGEHRPHPLAPARNQMTGKRRNQRNFALHLVEDDGVDRVHGTGRQAQHGRQ